MNSNHDAILAKIYQTAAKPSRTPAERDKASDAFDKFLKQLEDEDHKKIVSSVFTFLQTRRKASALGEHLTPPFDMVEKLRTLGFPSSVSSALCAMDHELAELELDDIRLITFRESIIENWLKQKAEKDDELLTSLKDRLFAKAISDPQLALASDLYSWFAKNLEAKRLPESKPLLMAAAARHHPKAAEMFAILVAKDKSGDFVIDWISAGEERLKRFIELSQIDSRLFDAIQKAAPIWLNHDKAHLLISLYSGMYSNIASRTGSDRTLCVAQLIALAGLLIPMAEDNDAAASILQQLQAISLAVWKETGESPERRNTWAIIQAGNTQIGTTSNSPLSPEAAAILGLAIRKARKGKDAVTELESALVNIGVERFGEIGSETTFDPIKHDDTEGGLIPGDAVRVTASGFQYQGKIIVKAPVTESENH